MFKKKIKICKVCGEVNSKKADFCRCCREDLDPKIYKVKKSVKTKADLPRKDYMIYYIRNLENGRMIKIEGNVFVERNPNDDIFDNVYLSNKHAMLYVKDLILYIRDLGSTNGTFINEKRMTIAKDYKAKCKDKVTFANIDFVVDVEIEVK